MFLDSSTVSLKISVKNEKKVGCNYPIPFPRPVVLPNKFCQIHLPNWTHELGKRKQDTIEQKKLRTTKRSSHWNILQLQSGTETEELQRHTDPHSQARLPIIASEVALSFALTLNASCIHISISFDQGMKASSMMQKKKCPTPPGINPCLSGISQPPSTKINGGSNLTNLNSSKASWELGIPFMNEIWGKSLWDAAIWKRNRQKHCQCIAASVAIFPAAVSNCTLSTKELNLGEDHPIRFAPVLAWKTEKGERSSSRWRGWPTDRVYRATSSPLQASPPRRRHGLAKKSSPPGPG